MLSVPFSAWKLHAQVLVAHAEDAIISRSPLYVPVYEFSDRGAQLSLCHAAGNDACPPTMGFGAPRSLRMGRQRINGCNVHHGYKRRDCHTERHTLFSMHIATKGSTTPVKLAIISHGTNCTVKDYSRSKYSKDRCCPVRCPVEDEIIL
jgi:hypothetical protein